MGLREMCFLLGRYPAQDMPTLVQQLQQIHSRASLLGITSAGSASPRGALQGQANTPGQGVEREVSLEAWAQNGTTAPADAPTEFSQTEWTPDDPAAFRAQEWQPEEAADSATPGWQPETSADFAPQEWQAESPEAFSPAHRTPELAEDFSPAQWAPEQAAGFSPAEWTPEATSEFAAAEWQLQEAQLPPWSQPAAEGFAAQEWQSDGSAAGFSPADFEAPAALGAQQGFRAAGWTCDSQGVGISPEEWAAGNEDERLSPAEWSAAEADAESEPAADHSGWEHPRGGSAQPDQYAAQQDVSSGHPAGQPYRAAQGLLPPRSTVSRFPEDGQGRPQPQQQQARQSFLLGDDQQLLLRRQGQNRTAGRPPAAQTESGRSSMPAAGVRPDYDQRALPQSPQAKVRHSHAVQLRVMSIAAFPQT